MRLARRGPWWRRTFSIPGIRVRTVLHGDEARAFMAALNAVPPTSHDEADEIIVMARGANEGEIVVPILNKCAAHGIWPMPHDWVEAHLGPGA